MAFRRFRPSLFLAAVTGAAVLSGGHGRAAGRGTVSVQVMAEPTTTGQLLPSARPVQDRRPVSVVVVEAGPQATYSVSLYNPQHDQVTVTCTGVSRTPTSPVQRAGAGMTCGATTSHGAWIVAASGIPAADPDVHLTLRIRGSGTVTVIDNA